MALPRTVSWVIVVGLAARAAWGASPCEESRAQTGLALAAREGGLEIAAVDPDSAAAESGLRAGDALVQVNATMPRSCTPPIRYIVTLMFSLRTWLRKMSCKLSCGLFIVADLQKRLTQQK